MNHIVTREAIRVSRRVSRTCSHWSRPWENINKGDILPIDNYLYRDRCNWLLGRSGIGKLQISLLNDCLKFHGNWTVRVYVAFRCLLIVGIALLNYHQLYLRGILIRVFEIPTVNFIYLLTFAKQENFLVSITLITNTTFNFSCYRSLIFKAVFRV